MNITVTTVHLCSDLPGLSDLSKCPWSPGNGSVSRNLQMQCNCSEMQEKKGLDCSAILFSLMWFILHLKISSKYINIRLTPQSPVLTSGDPCVVYRWLFLPSTFRIEFMCSGLKLEAQNFQVFPQNLNYVCEGQIQLPKLMRRFFSSQICQKVCSLSLSRKYLDMRQNHARFGNLWKLNLFFYCRSETLLQ